MRRSSPARHSVPMRVAIQRAAPGQAVAPTGRSAIAHPAPTSARPQFADVRLVTGVRLRYLEQGDPAGSPVILLHGLSDSWFSFSRILPGLSPAHRVYALDLRGHGDSDRPHGGYGPGVMATDVIAFMDTLGIRRATLVGHSMGSLVALQAAVAAPDRIARLALVGSATTVRNDVMLELQRNLAAVSDPVPADFVMAFQASTIHRPVPAGFLVRVVSESRKAPARVWRAALEGLLETERFAGLPRADIPSLLIWGDRDALFSRAEQQALVDALPVSSLRVYRETGHAPHWERPKEVVRDLERFLRSAQS